MPWDRTVFCFSKGCFYECSVTQLYNTVRPHSSLRYLTPEEFAESLAHATGVSSHADGVDRTGMGRFGCAGTRGV